MDAEIVVEVTQEHIENGKRSDGGCCPIALAMRAAIKEYEDIRVDDDFIEFEDADGASWKVTMPSAGKKFVKMFDDGGEVTPFTMTLSPKMREVCWDGEDAVGYEDDALFPNIPAD